MREFNNKQSVKVIADYNQFKACSNTVYHVETTNRINGQYSVMLSLNGKIMGAIDQNCLTAK